MSMTITTEANLTTDPELRYTKVTGQAVCTLRVAISTRRKNIAGDYEDTPATFHELTVWGQLAEHAADTLHKGDRVLLHGTAHEEQWTDRDGNTRIKHVIQATALGASLRYATATVHRTAGHSSTTGGSADADLTGAASTSTERS